MKFKSALEAAMHVSSLGLTPEKEEQLFAKILDKKRANGEYELTGEVLRLFTANTIDVTIVDNPLHNKKEPFGLSGRTFQEPNNFESPFKHFQDLEEDHVFPDMGDH